MVSVEEGSIPRIGKIVTWERLHAYFLGHDIKQYLVDAVAKLLCTDN